MPPAHPACRAARTRLTVEALDDRLVPSGTGLTREVWTGLAGTSLAPLTAAIANGVAPTAVDTIGPGGLFEAPRNVGDNYGQRVRGYFEAPVSGEYRFYIAADDHAELRLSTDATPGNARVIASVNGYTGSRQWTKFASQGSDPVALVAGERYYVEALQKEGGGADNLAVRVDVPGAPASALPASASLFDAFGPTPPPPPNVAPTLAVAPAPVTVPGTSAAFSALGADDGGEAALRYTWSVVTQPAGAAAPTFTANGTNAAKSTTVAFSRAGSYALRLTVTDAQGLSVTRDVTATVVQTVSRVAVTPGSATVTAGGTRQFSAAGFDQFDAALVTPPAFTWVVTGAGTVSSTGLFTAAAAGGSATVAARAGGVTSPAASVSVTPPATSGVPTIAVPAAATGGGTNPIVVGSLQTTARVVTGTTTTLSVLGADDGGEAALRYTWEMVFNLGGIPVTDFPKNGTNAAKSMPVAFTHAGLYGFRATITDADGRTATSTVYVSVQQTLTTLTVSPAAFAVPSGGTQQFGLAGTDQFSNPIPLTGVQWQASGAGTVSATGLFQANAAGGPATVWARVGGVVSNSALGTVAPPATGDWYARNLLDPEVRGLARTLAADGQLSRLDWLGILSSVQDNNVVDANEVADLQRLVAVVPLFSIPDPTRWLANRIATDTVANMLGTTFQTELVGRWFLGTAAATPIRNGNAFNYTVATGNLYGSSGHPRIGDIDQGSFGDCSFLAALGATFGRQRDDSGNATSSVIESMITDNADGTYTFRFYNQQTRQPEYVTVDRRIHAGGARRNGNIFWVALTERAYAQYLEWSYSYRYPGYNLFTNGDTLSRPLQYLTGRAAAYIDPNASTFFSQLQAAFSAGRAVETARLGSSSQYAVGSHAYSVTDAYVDANGVERIVVRNPWGVDGRTASGVSNDGFIDLTVDQFRANFNYGVNVA